MCARGGARKMDPMLNASDDGLLVAPAHSDLTPREAASPRPVGARRGLCPQSPVPRAGEAVVRSG